MTKTELELLVERHQEIIQNLEEQLRISKLNEETHKKASYVQAQDLKELKNKEAQDLKELKKKEEEIRDLEQKLKISQEQEETHKKASFIQTQDVKKIQLERDEIKREHEKLVQAYNGLAKVFDEYLFITKNTLKQLEGLTQASVMLEKQITQKIENLNKGVE